ncbi:hypothetical protein ACFLRC_01100 [Candidatus Altiarchaeota archaeon]
MKYRVRDSSADKAKTPGPGELKALGGKGVVVIADDNEQMRRHLVGIALLALGPKIEIIDTDNFQTALSAIKEKSHRVIGVVTDNSYWDKPGESRQLGEFAKPMVDAVKEINPDAPVVVYCGGFASEQDKSHVRQNATFIHKAGTKDIELIRKFKEVFEGRLRNLNG